MENSSSLLINEPPLQVLPSLANQIGLNEAIFLQQLHYWLGRSKNKREGRKWVYNTYDEWQAENFPFWSTVTIKRIALKLESTGLIISRSDLNRMKYDRTKWYTIDYDALNKLTQSIVSNRPDGNGHFDPLLVPETTA